MCCLLIISSRKAAENWTSCLGKINQTDANRPFLTLSFKLKLRARSNCACCTFIFPFYWRGQYGLIWRMCPGGSCRKRSDPGRAHISELLPPSEDDLPLLSELFGHPRLLSLPLLPEEMLKKNPVCDHKGRTVEVGSREGEMPC